MGSSSHEFDSKTYEADPACMTARTRHDWTMSERRSPSIYFPPVARGMWCDNAAVCPCTRPVKIVCVKVHVVSLLRKNNTPYAYRLQDAFRMQTRPDGEPPPIHLSGDAVA
jgi:hypothetical protein